MCCAEDEAGLRRRAEAIGRPIDALRARGITGTPAEVVDQLGRWAEAGTQRCYLQVLDLADLDHIALLGAEVLPAVRDR